jgi:hypothetical protein
MIFSPLLARLESENVPQKQLKETATVEMQKLMTLVQRTTVSALCSTLMYHLSNRFVSSVFDSFDLFSRICITSYMP